MILLMISQALAGDLLLTNARLWDGTGAPVQEGVSILVREGRVAAIGAPPAETGGLEVVDVEGGTVLPGLIDSHVHLVSNPGSAWRQDDEAARRAQLRQAMRAYLACGVTTIFDPGTLPEYWAEARAWLEAGEPGPEVHHAGIALSPVGGYLDGAFPGYPHVGDRAELILRMDQSEAAGASAFKATLERGFVTATWPVFDEEMRGAIVEEAARRGRPLYVHAIGGDELELALQMRPHGLVHTPEALSAAQLEQIKEIDPFVISTFAYDDLPRYGLVPARLQDPLTRLVVPPAQLATAEAPDTFLRYRQAVAAVLLPRARVLQPVATRVLGAERTAARRLARVGRVLHRLDAAGVRWVMGSDAGNWPVFPYLFHGVSSLRELSLLEEQGFSPAAALTAATRTAARMLGVDDRVGTVEVGKEADLVVTRGDPLQGLDALWGVRWTVVDGELRTPEAWMRD